MGPFKHKHATHSYRECRRATRNSWFVGDLVVATDLDPKNDAEALEELEMAAWDYVKPKGVGVKIVTSKDD